MEVKRGRDEIYERRLITDFAIAEQLGGRDVAAATMRFDAAPVIDSLEDVLAIFIYFQFDHHQTSIVTQRKKIDRSCAALESEATAM